VHGIRGIRSDRLAGRSIFVHDLVNRVARVPVDAAQLGVDADECLIQPPGKAIAIDYILDAQASALILVRIGRPNAPPGSAQGAFATLLLLQLIQRQVIRHHHMRTATDMKILSGNAGGTQHLELLDQGRRRDHHAVPKDARHVRPGDTRGYLMQLENRVTHDDSVPGIRATLVTHDHRSALGEVIGDLAFALVTPLSAKHDGYRHRTSSERTVTKQPRADQASVCRNSKGAPEGASTSVLSGYLSETPLSCDEPCA